MIKNKKAFTLIELIVTIAVLGILVLLASPRFFGHTQNAELTKGFANARTIEKASELYYMDNNDWPRLTDEPYTSEEIESYSERIFDRTGQEVNLDPEGNYYDIDYDKLSDYIQVPDNKENYILQNPVGKVFYMENLNETGKSRVSYDSKGEPEKSKEEILYEFTSATFTNAGATGRFGPTQEQLDSAYVGSEIEGQISSENGIQLWTVPKSGTYRIETYGAQGGNNGGKGSIMKGDFDLLKEDNVEIIVGQMGIFAQSKDNGGYGGGGGTFVATSSKTPLIVSGGGGGGMTNSTSIETRTNGLVNTFSQYTGEPGQGGTGDSPRGEQESGAGGGFYSNGETRYNKNRDGQSFINGGVGGLYKTSSASYIHVPSVGGHGGFGGGSSIGADNYIRAGSGGGYSGGNQSLDYSSSGGTGGGSFNSGANQANSVGNTGHGKVIITYIGE